MVKLANLQVGREGRVVHNHFEILGNFKFLKYKGKALAFQK